MRTARTLPLKTRTTAEPEPDLVSTLVTHRALRRDTRRLDVCLKQFAGSGPSPAPTDAVCRYAAALLVQVRARLESEAEVLWPVIAATAGAAVDLAPLADDHKAIEAAIREASRVLTSWRTVRSAVGAFDALNGLCLAVAILREMLDAHLDDEEEQVLPAMRRYLTAEACLWCDKRIWRKTRLRERTFAVPWLARYAHPDELRQLLVPGGPPAWVLLAVTRPGYARLEQQAFGLAIPEGEGQR